MHDDAALRCVLSAVLIIVTALGAPLRSFSQQRTAMTNGDVMRLVELGFSDADIITRIRSVNTAFDLSTNALRQLHQAGVSKPLLTAMSSAAIDAVTSGADSGGAAALAIRPAAPPPPPPRPDDQQGNGSSEPSVRMDPNTREQWVKANCSPLTEPNQRLGDGKEKLITWGEAPENETLRVKKHQNILLVVRQVNDVLYRYTVEDREVPAPIDDWAEVLKAGSNLTSKAASMRAAQGSGCEEYAKHLNDVVAGMKNAANSATKAAKNMQPGKSGDKFASVPLVQTVSTWNTEAQPQLESLEDGIAELDRIGTENSACKTDQVKSLIKVARETAVPTACAMADLSYRVSKWPHEVYQTVEVDPDTQHEVTISQWYQGTLTANGTSKVTYLASSYALTFSAGTLLTRLPNRAYSSVPAVSGTGNVLKVSGNSSLRPVITGLLNYELPIPWQRLGLALSAGPVVQFNSNDTSNLGFFSGISFHLWNRFFLTPGVHVGEVADFPQGFSFAGQPVPSGASLEPTKRFTPNFALGITFKTKDLGVLKGSSAQATGSSTTPGTSKEKK